MKLAPIALFVYNRLEHTKKTVQALQKAKGAKESILYIFSDGPKKGQEKSVQTLRTYLKSIKGFKKIIIHESKLNKGLAPSIIAGVSKVITQHEKIIVLEDDLIVRPDFLEYMNKGLETYQERKDIYEIAGHVPDKLTIPKQYTKLYFLNMRPTSWGWATWKDRWEKVDWEVKSWNSFKKNSTQRKRFTQSGDDALHLLKLQQKGLVSSWAIRWHFSIFQNQGWAISPTKTLVVNIGEDGSGVHCLPGEEKEIVFDSTQKWSFDKNVKPSKEILKRFKHIHKWNSFQKFFFYLITLLGYYSWRNKKLPKKIITSLFSFKQNFFGDK